MFLRQFKKFDRFLIGAALFAFLVSGYFIVNDDWLFTLSDSEIENLQPIGSVKTSLRDVRRRTKSAFSWLPLRVEKTVFQDDSIFTGDQSEAVIVTERGEEISIASNSLVVISARANSIQLNIDYGSVLGKVGRDQKLIIGSRGSFTEFTGDDAVVQFDVGSSEKSLVVNVIQGQVELKSGESTQTLGANEAAEIGTSGKISEPDKKEIQLVSPFAKKTIPESDLGNTIFAWKSEHSFDQFEVEFSDTENFSRVIEKEITNNRFIKPKSLPKDRPIYWRVKGLAEDKKAEAQSESMDFIVASLSAPELIFPEAGQIFTYTPSWMDKDEGLDLILKWKTSSASPSWKIQIAGESNFERILVEDTIEQTYYRAKSLKRGTYFWRVRSGAFAKAPWSQAQVFSLRLKRDQQLPVPKVRPMKSPVILTSTESKLDQKALNQLSRDELAKLVKGQPQFSWNSVFSAESYELDIARDPNFEQVLLNGKTKSQNFTWTNARPGTYFWRLRAIGKNKIVGPYTASEQLVIQSRAPTPTSDEKLTEEATEIALMETPPPPFILRWTPQVYIDSYEVEFANNKDFKNSLFSTADTNSKSIQVQKGGTYYWRVRAVSKDKQPLSAFSKTSSIQFERIYRNPDKMKELVPLSPASGTTLVLVGRGKNDLRFFWSNPFAKSPYRLQFSEHSDFKTPLLDVLVPKNIYYLDRSLPKGWIFWRVRAENQYFTSPWTSPSRFQVQLEGDAFEFTNANLLAGSNKRTRVLSTGETEDAPNLLAPKSLMLKIPFEFEYSSEFLGENPSPEKMPLQTTLSGIKSWPKFSWNPVRDSETYTLLISRDPKMTDNVLKTDITETEFEWRTATPGKYFVRVRALSKSDEFNDSLYSKAFELSLLAESPRPTSNTFIVQEHPDPRVAAASPDRFSLSWSSSAFGRKYRLEISQDIEFKKPQVVVTEKTSQEIQLAKYGIYFWRVQALDHFNNPVSEFSPLQALDVTRSYRAPANLSRILGIFPTSGRTFLFVGSGGMKAFFKWASPGGAKKYRLQISRTQNFSKPEFQLDTEKQYLQVEPKLSEGRFYWRVGEVSPSGAWTWSEPIDFEVKISNPSRN